MSIQLIRFRFSIQFTILEHGLTQTQRLFLCATQLLRLLCKAHYYELLVQFHQLWQWQSQHN